MASSVFFRFKSQKEPTRVTFDGTGISVFELKREIITLSRLGDGTDFELTLSSSDSNDVYDDDTTIIPRSTTVIARRLPASKPGRGGAARYVSGKMPVNAKNSHRSENLSKPGVKIQSAKPPASMANVNDLQTEEERMAAVLQMGADQWVQQQQQMATVTPVLRPGAKGKAATVPDHPPPAGYVCYRCGEKGHWIQVCPTNDDPNFENRPRIKRTTGIPKSFLRTVEKPTNLNDGSSEENKVPAGVMVNAEGDWVIAEPDKAAWEQFQAKAQKSTDAQQKAAHDSKEIHDRGMECPIDKRLFVEPSKTPCCQTTYCNECITNALLDDGLRCPNCGKEGILIDDLKTDDDMVAKIRSYAEEKAVEASSNSVDNAPNPANDDNDAKSPVSQTTGAEAKSTKSSSPEKSPKPSTSKPADVAADSKKRKADSQLANNRQSPAPSTILATKADKEKVAEKAAPVVPKFPPELDFMNQPGFSSGGMMPNVPAFPNMPMNMNMNMPMPMPMPMNMNMNMNMNMMGMNPAMWNQMMMPPNGMGNQWNGMNSLPLQQQANGCYGATSQMPMANHNGYGQPNGHMMQGSGQGMGRGNRFNNNFTHQQANNFNAQQPNNHDSAYFRQPVNPHRHQARRNVSRPADYREI